MKKIFTKFSLLFIGLMLCGNAWGQYPIDMGSSTIDGVTYSFSIDIIEPPYTIGYFAEVTGIDCESTRDTNYVMEYMPGYSIPMTAKKISIPASVTYNTIPYTVNAVSAEFESCTTVTFIQFLSTTPLAWNGASFGVNTIAEVPASALSAYIAIDGWNTLYAAKQLVTWDDGGGSGGDSPEPTSHEGDFGAAGNNLHWAFDGEHTLTISGTGAMEDFSWDEWYGDLAPWVTYQSSIRTVVIENGVTTIGQYAFYGYSAIETLTIPSSLTTVDVSAMEGCSGLTTINAESATSPCSLSEYAFGDSGLSQEITVNTPMGYVAAYEAAWSNVQGNFNFVEAVSDAVEFTNGNATTTIDALIAHKSETFTDFTMARPIQANGKLNTLCLPFNLSKEQIANSDLADATIYEFTGEGNITASSWDLEFTSVSTVKAGTPYLFAFEDADPSTPNLTELVFHDVTIVSNVEDLSTSSATYNNIIFKGTLNATNMTTVEHTYYFLGENNTLIWATGGSVYPFRAYFEDLAPSSRPANAKARIVLGRNTATAIENTNTKDFDTKKILENNQVIIIRNGVRYNVAGQVVK